MSCAKTFVKQIEEQLPACFERIDRAEKRGHFTDDDLEFLDRVSESRLPVAHMAYQIACEHSGKRYQPRVWLENRSRPRIGVYLKNSEDKPTIHCYGPVGSRFGGFTAEDVQEKLADIDSRTPLVLRVHSPGGVFSDGVAINSLIAARRGRTDAIIDGEAASAASVMIQSCNTITMVSGSSQMIHYSSLSNSEGNWRADDLERALSAIRSTNLELIDLYMPRWKGTREELDWALSQETYFSPSQAIARGLADYTSNETALAASAADLRKCKDAASYAIACRDVQRKHFNRRRMEFRLWEIAADDMRLECERN
jgi:ATP-dependent protease ClpP protease subunit